MRCSTFALALSAALCFAPRASAHPFAVGRTIFHDGVDKDCRLYDGNAAPWSPPSAGHPWGTVIAGCFRGTGDKTRAVVREWDLSSGRPVREATFPADPGANSFRVAVAGGRILTIVSAAVDDPIDNVELRLLDDQLAVVREWNLGAGGFADIDAQGTLGAVLIDRWSDAGSAALGASAALVVRSVDMRSGRITGRRVFQPKAPAWRDFCYPAGTVRVRDGSIFVAFAEAHDAKAYRMSSSLRITGGYARHGDQSTSSYFMALGVDGVILGYDDRVDVLRPGLTPVKRLGAPQPVPRRGPARWAVDPDTGRVATEAGAVAAHVGAPFRRMLDFTRESVLRGQELEIFADETTAVLWAFGRVVIVRDAPGLGIVAFDPGPGSAPDRQDSNRR